MKLSLNLQKKTNELLDIVNSIDDKKEKAVLLQKLIDWYKFLREEKNKYFDRVDDIEKEIKNIEDKTASVGDLLKIRERLTFEISKFGELSQDSTLHQKVRSQKISKIQQVMIAFKSLKGVGFTVNYSADENFRQEISFFSTILFSLMIILFTPILFYFSKNENFIIIGFVAVIAEFLIFAFGHILNVILNKNLEKESYNIGVDYDKNLSYDSFVKKYTAVPDSFFVNAAWISALKKELHKIDLATAYRLNGLTLDQARLKIDDLNKERDDMEAHLKFLLDTQPSAEEYLALRREQDIILMELESQDITVDDQEALDLAFSQEKNLDSKVQTQLNLFAKWLTQLNS